MRVCQRQQKCFTWSGFAKDNRSVLLEGLPDNCSVFTWSGFAKDSGSVLLVEDLPKTTEVFYLMRVCKRERSVLLEVCWSVLLDKSLRAGTTVASCLSLLLWAWRVVHLSLHYLQWSHHRQRTVTIVLFHAGFNISPKLPPAVQRWFWPLGESVGPGWESLCGDDVSVTNLRFGSLGLWWWWCTLA